MEVGTGGELVDRHRRIGAEREERRRAEIHIAAIAAENVPGRRQHDILQHDITGEEHVIVAERDRDAEHPAATARQMTRKAGVRTVYRPIRPAGRTASVNSRKPNDTAGAHDGP